MLQHNVITNEIDTKYGFKINHHLLTGEKAINRNKRSTTIRSGYIYTFDKTVLLVTCTIRHCVWPCHMCKIAIDTYQDRCQALFKLNFIAIFILAKTEYARFATYFDA